jgi:hypothetical protein
LLSVEGHRCHLRPRSLPRGEQIWAQDEPMPSRNFPSKTSSRIVAFERGISDLDNLTEKGLSAWGKIFGRIAIFGLSLYGLIHWILN